MIGEWMTPSPNPLPQGGEGLFLLSPLPVGEGWVRALFVFLPLTRVPREGGDPENSRTGRLLALIWTPAFAGDAVDKVGNILVLQQAQDEDELQSAAPSFFLMLSLSKHEEAPTHLWLARGNLSRIPNA